MERMASTQAIQVSQAAPEVMQSSMEARRSAEMAVTAELTAMILIISITVSAYLGPSAARVATRK
jgi:hypothetical protein